MFWVKTQRFCPVVDLIDDDYGSPQYKSPGTKGIDFRTFCLSLQWTEVGEGSEGRGQERSKFRNHFESRHWSLDLPF